MGVLDLIFPKYCVNCKKYGEYLCSDCFSRLSFDTRSICLACIKPSFDGLTHPNCLGKYTISGSFTGVVYNSVSKKLLHQFKYRPYLYGLGSYIADLLYESIIQNENFVKQKDSGSWLMVPIPLSLTRLRERGYNQSEILAKKLSKKLNLPVYDLLEQNRETKSELSLLKKERKKNMAGVFALSSKLKTQNLDAENIFLVDDVLGTGSTLFEAAKILKKAGAKSVWGIAFARKQ